MDATRGISSQYHTRFDPNEDAFNSIEYNGKKLFIVGGKYSLEYNKVNKEGLIHQVLYCINEANEGRVEVYYGEVVL